jgi:hypothetical protein
LPPVWQRGKVREKCTPTASPECRRDLREKPRMSFARLFLCLVLCVVAGFARAESAPPAEPPSGTPLMIGHRTLHVFHAPAGLFTAAERAASAKRRIE